MSVDLRTLRVACDLGLWSGRINACQWCDNDIPVGGRRSTWCSDKCRRAWERNHIWRNARTSARRRGKYECAKCQRTKKETVLEVNHINPVAGKGYGVSCSHHSSNLELLCHDCHVVVTAEQRATGLFNKPKKLV